MPSAQTLIDELLSETIRAYRRRSLMTGGNQYNLHALSTVDSCIERNIRALAILGEQSLRSCEAAIKCAKHPQEIEALVHISISCVLQIRTKTANDFDSFDHLLQLYLPNHFTTARDACWFFPVPQSIYDVRTEHIGHLLKSQQTLTLKLGIELTGLAGEKKHIDFVGRLYKNLLANDNPDLEILVACELTLARAGNFLPQHITRLRSLLQGNSKEVLHALTLIDVSGQVQILNYSDYVALSRSKHALQNKLASRLATFHSPAQAYEYLHDPQTIKILESGWRYRLLTILGFAQTLIECAASITDTSEPATDVHRDVLGCYFGGIPYEINNNPIDKAKREVALREAALSLFRRTHINLRNEANQCPWNAKQILADSLQPNTQTRLRYGDRLTNIPSLHSVMMEMSTDMRQLIYSELAIRYKSSIGFLPNANARIQRQLIGVSEWILQEF